MDKRCDCTLRGDNAYTVVPDDDCPVHGEPTQKVERIHEHDFVPHYLTHPFSQGVALVVICRTCGIDNSLLPKEK